MPTASVSPVGVSATDLVRVKARVGLRARARDRGRGRDRVRVSVSATDHTADLQVKHVSGRRSGRRPPPRCAAVARSTRGMLHSSTTLASPNQA